MLQVWKKYLAWILEYKLAFILGHNQAKIAHLAQDKFLWKFHRSEFNLITGFNN